MPTYCSVVRAELACHPPPALCALRFGLSRSVQRWPPGACSGPRLPPPAPCTVRNIGAGFGAGQRLVPGSRAGRSSLRRCA
eukprot:1464421-Lingulodinium_polyedra.AAC.1